MRNEAKLSGVIVTLDESLLEEYFSTTRVASRKQLIRTNSNQSQKGHQQPSQRQPKEQSSTIGPKGHT
jgi:hypothetical protein